MDFVPSSSSAVLGQTISVDLQISGLGEGAAPSLSAFDFVVGFDPTILGFTSFAFGTGLDVFGLGLNVRDALVGLPGELALFEVSLDSSDDLDLYQASSFVLGTISFEAIGYGTSVLSVLDTPFYFVDSNGVALERVEVSAAGITVPDTASTALLLGVALIACLGGERLAGQRRRLRDQVSLSLS